MCALKAHLLKKFYDCFVCFIETHRTRTQETKQTTIFSFSCVCYHLNEASVFKYHLSDGDNLKWFSYSEFICEKYFFFQKPNHWHDQQWKEREWTIRLWFVRGKKKHRAQAKDNNGIWFCFLVFIVLCLFVLFAHGNRCSVLCLLPLFKRAYNLYELSFMLTSKHGSSIVACSVKMWQPKIDFTLKDRMRLETTGKWTKITKYFE